MEYTLVLDINHMRVFNKAIGKLTMEEGYGLFEVVQRQMVEQERASEAKKAAEAAKADEAGKKPGRQKKAVEK